MPAGFGESLSRVNFPQVKKQKPPPLNFKAWPGIDRVSLPPLSFGEEVTSQPTPRGGETSSIP